MTSFAGFLVSLRRKGGNTVLKEFLKNHFAYTGNMDCGLFWTSLFGSGFPAFYGFIVKSWMYKKVFQRDIFNVSLSCKPWAD